MKIQKKIISKNKTDLSCKDKKEKVKKAVIKTLMFTIPIIVIITAFAIYPGIVFANSANSSISIHFPNSSGNYYLAEKHELSATAEGAWDDRHPIRLKGKGTLEAKGNGACRIRGRTDTVEDGIVKIKGNGVLTVRDLEGDIEQKITGYGGKVELKKDLWLYYGFNGTAEIKGSGFVLNIMGGDIEIYAKGQALVFLAGEGSYTVERKINQQTD